MKYYLFIFLVLFFLFPISSFTQPTGVQSVGRPANEIIIDLSIHYEYGFNTNLDGGGEFNLQRFSISGDLKKQLNDKWSISLDASYNLTDYDFTGSDGIGALNPWDKINRAGAGFRLNYQLSSKWGIGGGPFIRYSGETGADFSDSLTYGGTLGFLYTPSRNFFAGAGIFISSRIEDNVLIVPGVLFNWKVNEKLRISSLLTGVRTELGPRVQFNYKIGNALSAGVSVGYEFQRFRLNNEGVALGGVGDIKVLPVWGSLYYDINKTFRLAFYSGVGFFGNLELEDSDGNRIDREDFDPLIFIGSGLRVNL